MERAKAERTSYRRSFTTTANKLTKLLEEEGDSSTIIAAEFAKLSDRYRDLKDVQNRIFSLYLDSEDRDEQAFEADINSAEDYVDKWYLLQQKVKEYQENRAMVETLKNSGTSVSSHERHLRLPKLELPKFDGNVSKWLGFWAQFKKIHTDDQLDEDEKFQYLLQCMELGSSARELVESFPPTGSNYEIVVVQLKERFARDDIIIEHYVRELLQLVLAQTKGLSKPSTRYLYDKLMTQILALESLGVTKDKYASFLLPLVESAIPEDLLRAWNRSHLQPSDKQSTSLTELLNFLKKEVESEERIRLSRSGYNDGSSASTPTATFYAGTPKKDNKQVKSVSVQPVTTVSNKDCLWCEKSSHASSECRSAINMKLEERIKFVKDKNACLICLSKGHSAKRCRKFPKCVACGKRHFTLLCEDLEKERHEDRSRQSTSTNEQVAVSTSTPKAKKTVLLRTLKAKIVNGDEELEVRVFLDGGAQKSFIKTGVAERLKLQPIGTEERSHVLFGGTVTKKHKHNVFKVEVQNLDGSYSRSFEVLEQGTLCGHLPRIRDANFIAKLQNLGVNLTDCIDDDSDISLLIGSDVLGSLSTGREIQIDEGLLAKETKLGWTVNGPALGAYCSVGSWNLPET